MTVGEHLRTVNDPLRFLEERVVGRNEEEPCARTQAYRLGPGSIVRGATWGESVGVWGTAAGSDMRKGASRTQPLSPLAGSRP